MTDDRAVTPRGFSIDAYIQQGELAYPVSEGSIRLRVLLDSGAALHLHETPLSADQVLTLQKDGRELLQATALDTSELRWWLLGLGSHVEVLEPKELRREFRGIVTRMMKLYR